MTTTAINAVNDAERLQAPVAVVIINFRTPDLTIGCLQSLDGELQSADARAVVVDNHSCDGSADAIESWIKTSPIADRVSLVRSPENSGFSGGNNLGVKAIDADYYLLLNSDARLRPGALSTLLKAADRFPKAGAIAPRLEDEDGTPQQSCFRFMGVASEFLMAARSSPITALLRRFEVALPVSDVAATCDWASFACILIRGAAIKDVGLMDDGYFMYFEDADYCRKLALKGWTTVYDPTARAVHLRGGSSPVKAQKLRKKRPPAYYYASRTRYFATRYGPLGPVLANLAWGAGRTIAQFRRLAGKTVPQICENEAADIWINWRNPMGDRHAPVEN